jgi:DNA-binding beta-propeller fold protein YncE
VSEILIAPQTVAGTVGTMTFSPDAAQSCAYVADLSNNTIYEINRENAHELARVGTGGRQVGQFHWPHVVSVDSEGSLYTGEVDASGRAQRFIRYGASGCSGTGNPEIGKYQ